MGENTVSCFFNGPSLLFVAYMKQDPICVLNPPLKYMPFYDVFQEKLD